MPNPNPLPSQRPSLDGWRLVRSNRLVYHIGADVVEVRGPVLMLVKGRSKWLTALTRAGTLRVEEN